MRSWLEAKDAREAMKRRAAHHPNKCPRCGDPLDTGFECIGCGFDAAPPRQNDKG